MKPHLSLRGFITAGLLFVSAAAKGCDWPSAPQCFRRTSEKTMYICEWSSPYRSWNHTLYQGRDRPFEAMTLSYIEIREEKLLQTSVADIWVEARNTSHVCASEKTTVTLTDIVKYEKPHKVAVQWSQDNLTLQWAAPEDREAAVEIRHRNNSSNPWNNITQTAVSKNNRYGLTLVNLEMSSVQLFQMRQQSTKAKNSLWSDWSKILTAPTKFLRISKRVKNGTRRIRLKWRDVPSSDGEAVSYQVEFHSFRDCRCHRHQNTTSSTLYYKNVSYSALNISVRAMNKAGSSPPALFHVSPENPKDLKVCEETALTQKTKKHCCEWYELRNGTVKDDTVIILPSTKKSSSTKEAIRRKLKDFLPYVYFEHQCVRQRKETVKWCLYYKTQGKPVSPPPHFISYNESSTSASLSWAPIPTEEQRGFMTHYSLCIAIASTEGQPDCRNISASLKNYTVEKLTPGTKYNVSLKGVTSVGEGPPAMTFINTQPEKPYSVWLSFGLLIGFFLLSMFCTYIFARIKNKVLPPVPVPVIVEFSPYQPEVQDLLERKEKVHEVTLVQPHPECCPDGGTVTFRGLGGTTEGSSDLEEDHSSNMQSEENEPTPKDSTEEPNDLVQNEIALLIYRNGLVFDVNVDSS